MACQGLKPAAHVWQKGPNQLTISHTASHRTSTNTVIASAWKVFSRHKASVEPRLPHTSTLARVTANTRAIWPNETPPKRAESMNSGTAAANTTST